METMLTEAKERLARAEAKQREINAEVNALRQLVGSLIVLTGTTPDLMAVVQGMKRNIKEEIVEVLKDANGKALTGHMVAEEMKVRGFEDIKLNTVQTMLWNFSKKSQTTRVFKDGARGFVYRQ
jgi:hypothetical protein